MTIQDVAHHLVISWDVIKDIQARNLQRRFGKPKLHKLKQIAIDEINIGKGHRYLTIVLDLETGAVVYVGDGKGGTASASEIVSGAMQDHDRAVIVGQTSFGKGLVQGIFQLDYGTGLTLTTAKYYTPSGRLIQRDYSNASFYDYYTKGGLSRDSTDVPSKLPAGPETHTDAGRAVFGGGGIAPDEVIKPRVISQAQARLLNPLFFFARDLANGRVNGFDSFKVPGQINFNHRVEPKDFIVSDQLFQAFKQFALKDPTWKATAQLIDKNRDFVNIQLRFEMVTAAFGRVTADQVLVLDDPQVARAVDVVPRARELAQAFRDRRLP